MLEKLAETDQKDQIVLTLNDGPDLDLQIRSIDLSVAGMKVRFSTQSASHIEDTLHEEIAKTIRDICASSTQRKQIINVPDFFMQVRGLIVRGYTLLVSTLENGLRQFIIRLKKATGNAFALFSMEADEKRGLVMSDSELMVRSGQQVDSNRLFDEMLSHLYLPLTNLNTFLRGTLDGERQYKTEQLSHSVVQLKTKAEVLQFAFDRLISEMMLEKYTSPLHNSQATLGITDQIRPN